jgi:hypothetical protein
LSTKIAHGEVNAEKNMHYAGPQARRLGGQRLMGPLHGRYKRDPEELSFMYK